MDTFDTYKFSCRWLKLFVPNTVDIRALLLIDRINCRCLVAFIERLFILGEEKGKLTTLPWNSGEHNITFNPYLYAT